MTGSPLEEASWNGVEAVYYTGAGGGEMVWLIASVVCCVLALILGHSHESRAYKDAERRHED